MSNNTYNLPTLSNEGGLAVYLAQIKKFPMLDAEEEYMLAKNWQTTGNVKSAEKLVTSHLRLVAKIAMGYKGYGLPLNEMISEGNVGLMQAVKKFEPEKGFRLATYAMWWIKASIQEYILRSWSLVKIGTTTAQKKLFFNLKKLKNQIAPRTEGDLRDEHVKDIANRLKVSEQEVVSMNRRLSGKEQSLNAPIGEDGDEWQDWVVDNEMDQELKFAQNEEMEQRKDLLQDSIKILNEREKEILYSRRLTDDIGNHLGEKGHEFGTVTSRKRRCGWFDGVLVRQTIKISGIDGIALTKLDVLDELDEINLCVAYELNGKEIDYFPAAVEDQLNVKPVYKTFKGWKSKTQGIKNFEDLPNNAKIYVKAIEEFIETKISSISTSPERKDTILLVDPFNY